MKKNIRLFILAICLIAFQGIAAQHSANRVLFNDNWKFQLGEINPDAITAEFKDDNWRKLNLPHDWSIEFAFDKQSPTGTGGGALRGGLGWYRKSFTIPVGEKGKMYFIEFDGVYMNSEVFINGHSLGTRPNGYISFRYDLTPYIKYGTEKNIIVVKVDNARQPNSRWYSGSGIYRNVWLVRSDPVHVSNWGTFVTTPGVNNHQATVDIETSVENESDQSRNITLLTTLSDREGKVIAKNSSVKQITSKAKVVFKGQLLVSQPMLWSLEKPYLYKAVTKVILNNKTVDEYITPVGIRSFRFDAEKGFFLNDLHVKIRGVCMHHDLGCLGTAFNTRAMERQLEILKAMGCNGIRTSHNPPAPELLELCDRLGFIVMDEAFDMWEKSKNPFDYHLYWKQWHKQDLQDQVLRDRNHPSVFIWSLGNEIPEQWGTAKDSSGKTILRELASLVKELDTTRPSVTANDKISSWNQLLQSAETELTGYNYHHKQWDSARYLWGNKPFIVTESVSALQTRGHYDMPSDSIRVWPTEWYIPFKTGNSDTTCSAYDNCRTPWGSTHEETMKVFEKSDRISGMFIWTGFDYLGEPTPYPWPARSSYFGIVDLAGFPKDQYYMYQSVWTDKPVLHILPHWNWTNGQTIDVWAYYNNADEVELYLNGKSLGIKRKQADDLHVSWRTTFEPGILKAVSRKNGKVVLTCEIKTAGKPAAILLQADRNIIKADGQDLSFITVKVVDKDGNIVPDADNLVNFQIEGKGSVIGVDNGSQTSMESFKASNRKAFKGMCLVVVQANQTAGMINVKAISPGLKTAVVKIESK